MQPVRSNWYEAISQIQIQELSHIAPDSFRDYTLK
jgi:hypothetical protein